RSPGPPGPFSWTSPSDANRRGSVSQVDEGAAIGSQDRPRDRHDSSCVPDCQADPRGFFEAAPGLVSRLLPLSAMICAGANLAGGIRKCQVLRVFGCLSFSSE